MADTSITTRALTYRDPTVSAAADVQLRRNRQQSFERLVDQAQQTTAASAKLAQINQDKADTFRSAQDAADQHVADEGKSTAKRQTDQALLSESNGASDQQQANVSETQGQIEGTSHNTSTQPTATFSTQQIAQEHLSVGLHVPPLQPADEAYRRAGAEPPLTTENANPILLAVAV